MTNYYEGYVRARRILDAHTYDHSVTDEVVLHNTVRFRVGRSLVSLGHHLMGASSPPGRTGMRPAA